MKLLIVAINSKYTHTSLAVRCLYNSVRDICDAHFAEYTVNDSIDSIAADIYGREPDCVAFSCYIWNIEAVLRIAGVIKKAKPGVRIVLGGHEVEHDACNVLSANPQADAVLHGEGEISLRNYVECVLGTGDMSSAGSVTYRADGKIISLPGRGECVNLSELPFVYDDSIEELKNRIIYYETSRGCPYNCTYCLSGDHNKVRFLPAERVKKELKFFADHRVPLVKLVDRTFNADIKRAREIFAYIADNPSDTCFHMELSGDLIDEETLKVLSGVRKGALQFEIGVQTTNPDTMNAIERRVSFDRLKYAVTRLMEMGNIHIHLDLIAGLPYENMKSFINSFNEVIALRPHVLQLGFLKMLKGSKIRHNADKYGYVYRDYPPYEVMSNEFISYGELLELKKAEDALDKYYNSGVFANSLGVLMDNFSQPYEVFKKLGDYIADRYPTGYAFSRQALFDVLYQCFEDCREIFLDELKKDYLISFRPGKRPEWMGEEQSIYTGKAYELFKNEEFKKEHYPFYYDVPAKEIMKHIYCEKIGESILLFDYRRNEIYDITHYCDNI